VLRFAVRYFGQLFFTQNFYETIHCSCCPTCFGCSCDGC
jgi:hypothetical protein